MQRNEAIQAVHDRCAVFTAAETGRRLLDLIDWNDSKDLSRSVLLEPCAGEGALLVEAVERLVSSFRRHGHHLSKQRLKPRIKAFEFHPSTAAKARRAIELKLIKVSVTWRTARELARHWVREEDFLLYPAGSATHVVANPPYLRWSKLPTTLASEYRSRLSTDATRGDVSVAFLDRMLDWAKAQAKVSAITSDRWLVAQYGAPFISNLKDRGWALNVVDESPSNPFDRDVGVSAAIVLFQHKSKQRAYIHRTKSEAQKLHAKLTKHYGTLVEANCLVKVGPALGCGNTFVVSQEESQGIEAQLLRSFVTRKQLNGQSVVKGEQTVAVPYDRLGKAIDLEAWPGFELWISQHEAALRGRSQIGQKERWWRTIDAIGPQWNEEPKLLLAEMCKEALVTLDQTGSIPAHSIYSIWSNEWPILALQRVLNGGLLQLTAEAEAPRLKGDWFRFYKRFIVRTPLPKWSTLTRGSQAAFEHGSAQEFVVAFDQLFGFCPRDAGAK